VSDVNANIGIHFDTAGALAELRRLQGALSKFHQSLAQGNVAAANAQKGLNAAMLQSINATGQFSASQIRAQTSTHAFTSALEKNQLSLKQYFRYSAAAATANTKVFSRAFAAEREIFNRARRDRVKAIQSQYIQLAKANGGLVDAIRVMPRTLAMTNGKFTELGTRIQYAAQRQQLLNQLLKQGSTSLLNYGKNMQWAGRQLMVGLTIPLMMFMGAASKAFRELEKETVNFRRVYGNMMTSDAEANTAVENIKRIGVEYTKFGLSVKDTMAMAAKAAAAGFSGRALEEQVKTATKLAVLGQVDQQQALETTISLTNSFGIAAEDLAKKIDFLNAVENQTVLSIEDLTIAIPKAAPVVKQLGGSVEDLAFFLTAMKEGGINASEGANALKSGLAALINPTKKASAMLAGMGINVQGIVEQNAGNLKNTVIGFAQALDTLDPLNRARAIEQMFGKFQFARLSTLFQNITADGSQASRTLALAGASVQDLAILSERELGKVEDAVGVKFQAAIEKFKVEIMPLGKAFLEALTPVVKFFGGLMEKFNNLSDGTKKFVTIMLAVLGGIGPVVLMTFGLLANGVANVIKFFAMLRGGIAKLNGQTKLLGSGFDYLTQDQLENTVQSNALHGAHQKLIQVFGVERASVEALGRAYQTAASQARTLAASSPGLFTGGKAGATAAKAGLKVKKYKDGVLTVPGPKGAGDIQPAMLAPGEAVIPAKLTEKHHGLLKAIFTDSVPGHMAGKLPAAKGAQVSRTLSPQLESIRKAQDARRAEQRQRNLDKYPWIKPQIDAYRKSQSSSQPLFLGMPKSFDAVTKRMQQELTLKQVAEAAKNSRFGSMAPTDFGRKIADSSGRSFPVPGIGGMYQKPNGDKVFVKPMVDEKAALAEQRATVIARQAHGLDAPMQTIRTMRDPLDPSGKRKIIVLESPFDAKFAEKNMGGKFSKEEYFRQLVAANLRGDRDLHGGNLSGNKLADAGTMGVFQAATQKLGRDYAKPKDMLSMEKMANINLLGEKGGARRFFAESTLPIPKGMSAAEYNTAMRTEIETVLPKLRQTVKGFGLNKDEKVVYNGMIKRLEQGLKVDWSQYHAVHSAVKPSTPKQATAAEIIKKFEEQQLKQRQAGHANQDFWVSGHMAGVIPDGPTQAKAMPPHVVDLERYMDDVVRGPEITEKTREAWRKKKPLFLKNLAAQTVQGPDGLIFTGRKGEKGATADHLKQSMRYLFDVDSQKGKRVSDRSFANWSKLKERLTIGGPTKAAGGFKSNNIEGYKEYKAVLAETEAKNKALGAQGEVSKLKAYMQEKYPNLDSGKIARLVQIEAAHVEPGKAEKGQSSIARAAEKWNKGYAFGDLGAVNNYLTEKRTSNLIAWDKKNGNLLGTKNGEYNAAAKFLASGRHPITAQEAMLVSKAAELELKAHALLETKKAPPGLSGMINPETKYAAEAAKFIIDERTGKGKTFYDDIKKYKQLIDLRLNKRTGEFILATPGEGLRDNKTGKIKEIKATSGKAKTGKVKRVGGTADDTRVINQPAGTSVVAKKDMPRQTMRAKAKGDTWIEKRVALQKAGATEAQLAQALRDHEKLQEKARAASLKAAQDKAAAEAKAARTAEIRANEEKNRADRERRAELTKQREEEAAARKQKAENKQTRKLNLAARQEKVGKIAGPAAGAIGAVAMGAMMGGADAKVTTGLFAASAVAGMLPMLMNPWIAAGVALTAVIGAIWLYRKAMDNARKEGVALGNSMSMTTDKLIEISKITKTVSATESANKRRADMASGVDAETRKSGQTYLTSGPGKALLEDINVQAKTGASQTDIGKNIALQLGTAISQGVLSMDQARSIASALGEQLGSYEIPAVITGELSELLGPNGQDLLNNPLQIIAEIQARTVKGATDALEKTGDTSRGELWGKQPGKDAGSLLKTGAVAGGVGLGIGIAGGAAAATAATAGTASVLAATAATNFWNPVGWAAAVATIAVGAKLLWDWNKAGQEKAKLDSAAVQMAISAVESGNNAVDALNKQYDIKLAMAKTDAERAQIEKDRARDLGLLTAQNKADLDSLVAAKANVGGDAFNDAIKLSVGERYKDSSSAMKTFADNSVTRLEGMKDSSFKTVLQLDLAAGSIDPLVAIRLADLAESGGTFVADFELLVAATGSTAEANVVMQMLMKGGATDNTIQTTVAYISHPDNKVNIKENTEAINILSNMKAKYGTTVDINVDGINKIKKVAAFKKVLDGFKTKDGKAKSILTKIEVQDAAKAGDPTMQAILANWNMLVGADGKQITTSMMMDFVASGDSNVIDAYMAAKGIARLTGDRGVEQRAAIAKTGEAEAWNVGNSKAANKGPVIPGVTTPVEKAERAATPIDDLMTRLKNVRLAAIDAEGGIKALFKAVSGGQIGNKFNGIQQQLMGMKSGKPTQATDPTKGYNGQFIDWFTGLDKTEQAKYGKVATKKVKSGKNKGRVLDPNDPKGKKFLAKGAKVGDLALNTKGKEVAAGFDKAIIGDFNVAQIQTIRNFDQQSIVMKKLAGLGMTNTQIQRVLSDEAYTTAIATGKITDEELRINNALAVQADTRDKINNIVSQGARARQENADMARRQELQAFLASSGLSRGISEGAMTDALGDPEQLSTLLAAMDAVKNKTAGANASLQDVVDSLNEIKKNSDIKVNITKTVSEIIMGGASAAQEALGIKSRLRSRMTGSELAGYVSEKGTRPDGTTYGGVNVGAKAVANVASRMIDPTTKKAYTPEALTSLLGNKTQASVGKERSLVASQMNVANANMAQIQTKFDNISKSMNDAVDAVNADYDAREKAVQDKINKLQSDADTAISAKEDKIKKDFDDPIKKYQDKSNVLSHDLSLIDKAAEDINKKYDLQAEALQNVLSINERISREQQQQLGLADALSSGDISAAAAAVQDIRSANAGDFGNAQMDGLNQSRENDVNALTNKDGKTRTQILEEQYIISEQIYALENNPERVLLEQQIADIKTKLESDLKAAKAEQDALEPARQAAIAAAKAATEAQLKAVQAEMDAQQAIVTALAEQDASLATQEAALIAINAELDDVETFAGLTADDWERIALAAEATSEAMEKRMKDAIAAVAESTAKGAKSMADILRDINLLPSSKTIEIFTKEYKTVYVNTVATTTTVTAPTTTTTTNPTVCTAPLVSDGKGNCVKPEKPAGDYGWDNAKGWVKGGPGSANDWDFSDNSSGTEKNARDAAIAETARRIKEEAEAKAAAEALALLKAKEAAELKADRFATDFGWYGLAKGGIVPKYMSVGGFAKGTDTVPAMLTPGEFVMSKYAVDSYGVDRMKAINNGDSIGDSVYNYSINVNVKSDSNPDEIAKTVIAQIKGIDAQKIRGNRL
jgi:hypothetical protein